MAIRSNNVSAEFINVFLGQLGGITIYYAIVNLRSLHLVPGGWAMLEAARRMWVSSGW